jgi:hypothetical protein
MSIRILQKKQNKKRALSEAGEGLKAWEHVARRTVR